MKYYARLTHEGITKELMVNNEGKLRVAGMSLKGSLETNATYVDCYNNQLTELNCPVATHIYCYNNKLTKLSCPVAVRVDCSNNKLTKLSCPKATCVYCENNQLTELSCPVAVRVHCFNNKLTKLSCPKATCVYCENNQLTELSCPVAVHVYCYDNKLTKLSCPVATRVYCYDNQLTELSCPKATYVYCYDNQLTELSCPVADYVYCYKNKLTELNCPNIETLYSDIIKLNGVANMVGVDGIISKVLSTHTLGEYIIHKTVRYYIAVNGKYSAHGKTIKEAIDDCLFKELNENKDKSEIIASIKAKGTMNWIDYRLLTGSCREMTLEFLKEKGIEEDAEVSIKQVLSMTEGRFGHDEVRGMLC